MIFLSVPSIPPSVNKAYFTKVLRKKGKSIPQRILTKEGQRYKRETKTYIARYFNTELAEFRKDEPMGIIIEVLFPEKGDLFTTTAKAENRYKRLDVSNRIKLFEDALADAVGWDDSHNFFVGVSKRWVEGETRTNLWAWNLEREPDNPIHELLTRIR